jgi:hypothetical protein
VPKPSELVGICQVAGESEKAVLDRQALFHVNSDLLKAEVEVCMREMGCPLTYIFRFVQAVQAELNQESFRGFSEFVISENPSKDELRTAVVSVGISGIDRDVLLRALRTHVEDACNAKTAQVWNPSPYELTGI